MMELAILRFLTLIFVFAISLAPLFLERRKPIQITEPARENAARPRD
jgi:hypothetical protein